MQLLTWSDFFEESIVHVALVSAYCICKENLLKKKHSWQINSKSSGKSILRRPPKIALTVYTVLSLFKHFLLGRLRVRGLTWSRLPQKENSRNYFVNNTVTRFKLNFQWYSLIACVNIGNTYSLNKGLTRPGFESRLPNPKSRILVRIWIFFRLLLFHKCTSQRV